MGGRSRGWRVPCGPGRTGWCGGERGRRRGGVRAGGGGGGGRGGVRGGGGRREADRGQRTLALPDRGRGGFYASYPAITGIRRQTAWTTRSKSRSHCTAGR